MSAADGDAGPAQMLEDELPNPNCARFLPITSVAGRCRHFSTQPRPAWASRARPLRVCEPRKDEGTPGPEDPSRMNHSPSPLSPNHRAVLMSK